MVKEAVTIPVIASSGAGKVEHFSKVFEVTNVNRLGRLYLSSQGGADCGGQGTLAQARIYRYDDYHD